MTEQKPMTREVVARKVFLKRQLIEIIGREIKELEKLLKVDDTHVQTEPKI